jgi:cytochrome b561
MNIMAKRPHYGTTTKVFHWLIVALLIVQYPLGKFMPDIHRGMTPGDAMTLHISFGITILAVMVSRLCCRITHSVAPARWLPVWQQLMSEAVHWLLYVLVLVTTMTGWIFGSERGWSISLFFAVPLPMLPTEGSRLANEIGKWARHHGMGAVAGDRCPRGRRHRAQVCFPRPDHTADDAAGEADGRADREPEARGRSDEARPAIAGRLMIRVAEPWARSDLA